MSEIEQLRNKITAWDQVPGLIVAMMSPNEHKRFTQIYEHSQKRLAKLEAEAAAKANPWAEEEQLIKLYQSPCYSGMDCQKLGSLAVHLQGRIAELEADNARLERSVAGYKRAGDHTADLMRFMLDRKEVIRKPAGYEAIDEMQRLDARIAELETELSRRPVVWCAKLKSGEMVKQTSRDASRCYREHTALYRSHSLAKGIHPDLQIVPYTGEQS